MATWTASEGALANRVSWGALFAGFFFGFGIWLVLLALGAGIGLTAVDPRDPGQWANMGLGFGIWGVLAGIVSMFLAGWLAARTSAADERSAGTLHGLAVWGLMVVAGIWLAATAVGKTAGAAAGVAGSAAQAAGEAASDPTARQEAQAEAEPLRRQAEGVLQQAQQNAGQAADAAKTAGAGASWGFFLYGVLTLAAAALGGRTGIPRARRLAAREQERVPPGPLTPQRA